MPDYQPLSSCRAITIFAWLPTRELGREPSPVRLAAVDPGSRYRDRESGREFGGALLREYGLPLELPPGDYASALTVLDRIPDAREA